MSALTYFTYNAGTIFWCTELYRVFELEYYILVSRLTDNFNKGLVRFVSKLV